MAKAYEVKINEKVGACDSATFEKMAQNGDINSEKVTENVGKVITLTGYMKDGMDFDSAEIEQMCIPKHFSSKIMRGIRITENSLLPVYAKGDILLLDEDMARSGDTAVVQNMKTRKLYVRKIIVKDSNCYELHPVHGRGTVITITQEERTEWFDYGRIITVLRSNELNDEEE